MGLKSFFSTFLLFLLQTCYPCTMLLVWALTVVRFLTILQYIMLAVYFLELFRNVSILTWKVWRQFANFWSLYRDGNRRGKKKLTTIIFTIIIHLLFGSLGAMIETVSFPRRLCVCVWIYICVYGHILFPPDIPPRSIIVVLASLIEMWGEGKKL